MATNNFKLFDENKANMLADGEYNTNTQRMNGVQAGVASSKLNNKFAYQVSLVAYAIAQLMNANGLDANDSAAVSTFTNNLSASLVQKVLDKATTAQIQAGTDDTKWVTPALVKAALQYFTNGAGSNVVNVPHGGTGLSSIANNAFLVGTGGNAVSAKTVAQVQTLLGFDKIQEDIYPVGTIVSTVDANFNDTMPGTWLLCNGEPFSSSTYPDLAGKIGVSYFTHKEYELIDGHYANLVKYVISDGNNGIAGVYNVNQNIEITYSNNKGDTYSTKTIYNGTTTDNVQIFYFGKVNNKYVIIFMVGENAADLNMLESSTLSGNYTLHKNFINTNPCIASSASLMYNNGKYIFIFSSTNSVSGSAYKYIAFSTSLYSGYIYPTKPSNDATSYNSNIVYSNGYYFYIHKESYSDQNPGLLRAFSDINENGFVNYKNVAIINFGDFGNTVNTPIELDVIDNVVYAKGVYAVSTSSTAESFNIITNIRVESGDIKCDVVRLRLEGSNDYQNSMILKIKNGYIYIRKSSGVAGYIKIYSNEFSVIGMYAFNSSTNKNNNGFYIANAISYTHVTVLNDELYFSLYDNNANASFITFNIKNLPLSNDINSYNFIKALSS